MTTFDWSIVSMPAYPQEAGESDVVFAVNWKCVAINDKGAAVTNGTVPVTYEAGSPFTPYNQLTQEQIWGWINPSIDRPEVEANLEVLIDAKANPPVIIQPLPWQQSNQGV